MGLLSWILLGLLAGAVARWLLPGSYPMGLLRTTLLGVAGAFAGGFLSTRIGYGTVSGVNLDSLLIASVGAFLLLFGYRLLTQKRD